MGVVLGTEVLVGARLFVEAAEPPHFGKATAGLCDAEVVSLRTATVTGYDETADARRLRLVFDSEGHCASAEQRVGVDISGVDLDVGERLRNVLAAATQAIVVSDYHH